MSLEVRSGLIGVASLVVVTLVVGAQPILADTERGHIGSVGFHRLRDSSTSGGASCSYTSVEPAYPDVFFYDGRLDWISVEPPKVRAISGTQEVGWRFVVQRRSFDDWSGWMPSRRDRFLAP